MNHCERSTSPHIHLSDNDQLEPNLDDSIRNLSHNMLAQLVDSDEEFEDKPRDTGWIRAKPSDEKRKDISPKIDGGRKRRKDASNVPVRKKDSFVVEGDEVEEIEELSQLEILERQLEMQRKAKKKLKSNSRPKNRRRIIDLSDSD
nr:unnamed protein product [Callosobruchus chinensis]